MGNLRRSSIFWGFPSARLFTLNLSFFAEKGFPLLSLSLFPPFRPLLPFRFIRAIFQMTALFSPLKEMSFTPHGYHVTPLTLLPGPGDPRTQEGRSLKP